jgi:hypothetical protein
MKNGGRRAGSLRLVRDVLAGLLVDRLHREADPAAVVDARDLTFTWSPWLSKSSLPGSA